MAANPATVIGQGGTTITLNWQTASNAAIAQKALGVITGAVTSGGMQEVSYTGGSTLPALVGTVPGVVLAEGTTQASHTPFELSGQYQVAISNDTTNANPQGVVVGVNAQNDQIFIGGGGGGVVNFGINTQAFFTGASSLQSFQNQGFLGLTSPTAELWVDGVASVDGSAGATTTHLDTTPGVASILGSVTIGSFGNQLHIVNNGNGHNTVNLANSTVSASGAGTVSGTTTVNGLKQDVLFLEGSSSVATTVNASGSTATVAAGTFQPELWVVANGGSGVINGGAQAILAFSSGNGVLSVNGGTAAGDIDVEAAGFFKSGSGGGAIMASHPVLATTLVGGGNNDIMFGLGNNTTMIAGAGSQTEASFALGGETFMGNLGAGASTTTMITEISGGNKFITGNGTTNINALGGTNTFSEGVTSTAGSLTNVATITGFNTGTDTISLVVPNGGGTYSTISSGTPTASQILVTTAGGNSTLQFGDGSKWTIVGATITGSNFH